MPRGQLLARGAAPMKPTPKLVRGRWQLDLRWAGGGQYTLSTPGDERLQAQAIHEAYARYDAVRARAAANAQQLSFAAPDGGPLLREVIELYWRGRETDDQLTADNRRYVRSYLTQVERELGHVRVAAFAPPHGNQLLKEYRNDLAKRGRGPKTRRNRLNHVMQLLTFAHGRGWLPAIPVKPVPTIGREVMNDPVFEVYSEADFRRLRDELYADHDHPGDLRRWYPDRDRRLDYIARRKLYLSVAFYTGQHTRDLDQLTDVSLNPRFDRFLRVNTKSARCVAPRSFKAPEQLSLDGMAELERLGRLWHKGEPIAGGPWPQVTRVLQSTAKRLGLPRVNLRILRRSCAWHLCVLGWAEEEVAELLGHVDRTMVSAVYRRVEVDLRARTRMDWTVANIASVLGDLNSRGRVLSFMQPIAGARKGPHQQPGRGRALQAVEGGDE